MPGSSGSLCFCIHGPSIACISAPHPDLASSHLFPGSSAAHQSWRTVCCPLQYHVTGENAFARHLCSDRFRFGRSINTVAVAVEFGIHIESANGKAATTLALGHHIGTSTAAAHCRRRPHAAILGYAAGSATSTFWQTLGMPMALTCDGRYRTVQMPLHQRR
jgi:hypothetical protein